MNSNPLEVYDLATRDYLSNLASPRTKRNYTARLGYFRAFWAARHAPDGPAAEPQVSDVRAWRDALRESGLKPSTVRQYMIELSAFFAAESDPAMGDERRFEQNPVPRRLLPQTAKEEARPYELLIPDPLVAKLWENDPMPLCDDGASSPRRGKKLRKTATWPRNYAIVVLLLSTEIRNAELLALTPADLDWENEEIRILKGKGNKYRRIDFPEIAQTAIQLYLNSGLRPAYATSAMPLFGTTASSTFGPAATRAGATGWHQGTSQWLSALVERHVEAVTGVQGVRTHALRHVGARLDLNAGMRVEALQSKLGHAQISTTQIYSGRLLPHRARDSARAVLAARDAAAEQNSAKLEQEKPKTLIAIG